MKKSRIKWECNNWFKTDDGLVYIVNQSGNRIILNDMQGKVWEGINYQTDYETLLKKLNQETQLNEISVEEALEVFQKNKLISVMKEADLFNSIFG